MAPRFVSGGVFPAIRGIRDINPTEEIIAGVKIKFLKTYMPM